MLKWLRQALQLDPNQRQNITTFSMMGGTMALTVVIGLLVWVLRYSWPEAVAVSLAAVIADYLFKIIMAFIGLQAVQIFAQAAIAIGGKIGGKIGLDGVEVEANSEKSE